MKPPLKTNYADDFQTPPEALTPLLPYLKKGWVIWECACGNGNLVRQLRKHGFKVIGTDIISGKDFLKYEPKEYDCIITNPPYSLKYEFLERAYSLNKPFAFLLPITTFETSKRQDLFKDKGIEVIFIDKRINFETPYNKESGSWFAVAWFTNGLKIGKQINFKNIDDKINLKGIDMFTQENYFEKVSSIDYDSLPDALKEGYDTIKFGSRDYTTWEHLKDDKEFLALYFEKLNAHLSNKEKSAEEKPKKAKKQRQKKTQTEPAENKIPETTQKKQKPKQKRKAKQKTAKKVPAHKPPKAKPVEKVDEQIYFIKRYVNLVGREKTQEQILHFINGLQKAIVERRIRKKSKYAKEIEHIQDELIKCYNKMKDTIKITMDTKTLEKYIKIAGSEKTMLSIAYIKEYIRLNGKKNVQEKAQKLFDKLKKAVEKKKILQEDPYADELNIIYQSLNKYLTGKSDTPEIQKSELNGLMGIAGCHFKKKKKV